MSSKPFFKKSLESLLKLFSNEVVEEAGKRLVKIGDFALNFKASLGSLVCRRANQGLW